MNETMVDSLIGGSTAVIPEAVLLATGCLLLLGATIHRSRNTWTMAALIGLVVAAWIWWITRGNQLSLPEYSLFQQTSLTWFIKGLGLITGIVLTLLGWNKVPERYSAEFQACLLFIIAGVNLVAAANDLISLFLALELTSIPTYVLLYLPRYDSRSQEAATKYFLLSVFSSAITLFGFSYLYGLGGSTNLEVIRAELQRLASPEQAPLLGIALVTIVAGLGFRITAVPFHFYAPDVYQGAPTVGAALLASVPKTVGFTSLFLVVTTTLLAPKSDAARALEPQAYGLFWILAAASMSIGNILALLQNDLRRLLAYSSVAHAGYMLVALGAGYTSTGGDDGIQALFFYLVVYGAATIGAFAILAHLSGVEREARSVDDLAGLAYSHPLLALLMVLFLFSLTGLPPTAGFWAKLNIFLAAWSTQTTLYQTLAVIMAINAAIAGWYYVRIIAMMFLRQPGKELGRTRDFPGILSISICAFVTLLLFVAPNPLWRFVGQATSIPLAQPVATSAPNNLGLARIDAP